MTILILGVAIWIAAHFFKRLMPAMRAQMGDRGKGVVALLLVASIVLMVLGYRASPTVPIYTPMAGMGHANNLVMLVAIFMMGAGSVKGVVASKLRHPMLIGVLLWAVAHLLVNGDLASLILFGGMGVWSLLQMRLINRAEGTWDAPAAGPIAKDVRCLVITLVLYAVMAGVHMALGYSPFLGTYG
jgi:uncharacterized membrane protein